LFRKITIAPNAAGSAEMKIRFLNPGNACFNTSCQDQTMSMAKAALDRNYLKLCAKCRTAKCMRAVLFVVSKVGHGAAGHIWQIDALPRCGFVFPALSF
jgi:hypothetical protein